VEKGVTLQNTWMRQNIRNLVINVVDGCDKSTILEFHESHKSQRFHVKVHIGKGNVVIVDLPISIVASKIREKLLRLC
jgi:hypothetical protein